MKKLIPIVIILIALVAIAWYYASGRQNGESNAQSVESARTLLVGTWQSADDEKSIIAFQENGTQRDLYDGKQLSTGTWEVFMGDDERGAVSSLFLRSLVGENEYEYSIWNIDESQLVLNYLARGNTLSYVRVDDSLSEEWELYANADYGFALQHPTTWEVQESLKPQEARAEHEVMVWEREYADWRGSVAIRAFANEEELNTKEWWDAWLADEDEKEKACREEYGDESPCLFLRGMVERESASDLGGRDAITVGLFRFDHEEECTYAAHGAYVFGLCAPAAGNPNDSSAAEHRTIAERIQNSFGFAEF